ncbi:MAG: amino acid aminotransferase [Ignavibacteriae bacterium]|nr:MAG: amino acid aminotransferase [Ignavibacteriota bacterium]
MSGTVYFVDDKYVNKENAFIHVNDIGLLRGYAVFDYLKTYFGKPFRLSDHIERLQNSARYIGLSIPYSNDEIKNICNELLNKNNFAESNIRIVVTGGVGTDSKSKGNPVLIVTCEPRILMNPEYYTDGIKLKTVEGSREISLSKTCNYIRAIDYLDEYRKLGFSEVLYVQNNKVLECTSSNAFLIKDNTIITPDTGVLMGITRKVIFEICEKFMSIETREVELDELLNADEVFISSTEREIMPVIMIDDKEISGGKVGEKTKRIHKEFIEYVKSLVWVEK